MLTGIGIFVLGLLFVVFILGLLMLAYHATEDEEFAVVSIVLALIPFSMGVYQIGKLIAFRMDLL